LIYADSERLAVQYWTVAKRNKRCSPRCPAALDNPSEVIGELVFFNDEKVTLRSSQSVPERGLYDGAIKPGSIVVDGDDVVEDGSD
jgi:hypothetical protein